ncbi:hypothetical protein ACIA8M_36640 [Streptomyces anulatus]
MDVVDPVAIESAAALARHLRQGRDRRLAVLDWFAEAGMPQPPGAVQVPEPPVDAVREALVWVLRGTVSHQLIEVARSAATAGDEEQDALYALAERMIGSRGYREAAHPALLRSALLADEDVPEGPEFKGMVHLVAAIGLGAQEVGADALAEAFGSYGMFGLTVEDWARMLGAAERGEGPPVDWGLLRQHADVLGPVRRASGEELMRARAVLVGLRAFYAMYMMHALFMPDTPGLAALRDLIDSWGMGPFLAHMISLNPSPRQFTESLTVCLDPLFDQLYEALTHQLAQDPYIFRIPGDETGAAGFMETWMSTLREQAAAAGERRGGGEA